MNSDDNVRELTYQHAMSLNAQYAKVIDTLSGTLQNIDQLAYWFPDVEAMQAAWVAQGGQPQDLIEPTDGFHPSQTGQMLFAENLWNYLAANYSSMIGDVNQNNAQIAEVFGAALNGY